MTPDNPFLQALLADPADDTRRLVLADWLDENDQPARAEFVRVQVELAAGVAAPDRRRHLERRQRDLLVANEAEWVRPLAAVLGCGKAWGGWVFRRGFVEYFHLPGKVAVEHGGELAALTPVRELFLRPTTGATVAALCRRPWVASLTGLYLHGCRLTNSLAATILQCPHLSGLRVLDVRESNDFSPRMRDAVRERFGSTFRHQYR